MKKPASLPALHAPPEAPSGCPFRRGCHCADSGNPVPVNDQLSDPRFIQVRRQGIYLAACVIDEVAALDVESPQAVIDEIRRRICELVRYELASEHKG